jgi:hypothetical protein
MYINSVAISLIVDPVSLVNVPINMDKFTLTKCTIIFPISFITCPVWPSLFSYTISEPTYPLADVVSTRLKDIDWSFLSLGIRIVGRL